MSQSIPLRRGQVTLVDDQDHSWLSQYRWRLNDRGYVVRSFMLAEREIIVGMHHEIMVPQQGLEVDHKDHDKLNNVRSNLRILTRQQNLQNRRLFKNNLSGYKGVSRQHDQWHARIHLDRKLIHLGYFDEITDAALAYDYAAQLLFGEYALMNFPDEKASNAVQTQVNKVLARKHLEIDGMCR